MEDVLVYLHQGAEEEDEEDDADRKTDKLLQMVKIMN